VSVSIGQPKRASPGSDPRSLAGRPTAREQLLGQVLTPQKIASRMARTLLADRPRHPLLILDPCVGPGTFVDALAATGSLGPADQLVGVDIDPVIAELVRDAPGVEMHIADFLYWTSGCRFDAAILNPPYVRQEWLDDKDAVIDQLEHDTGARVPGSANLYVYFLVKTVAMLKHGGRLSAIVYDSWRHTKYGQWLQGYLDQNCTTLRYAQVEAPFRGRLIDATIISGVRGNGGRHSSRRMKSRDPLDGIAGLRQIDDLYTTRRGLRLKQAAFFLCDLEDGERVGATPFVKRVRHVKGFAVAPDHPEAALLVGPGEVAHPAMTELQRRLRHARTMPDENVSILTWAQERPNHWFSHKAPAPAPLLVNYFLRGRARHIRNPGLAYSDNFYGLTPRKHLDIHVLLALLNATVTAVGVLARSRTQGGGLRKVQLFEYRSAYTPDPSVFDKRSLRRLAALGRGLASGSDSERVLEKIDDVVASCLGATELRPRHLQETLAPYLGS
jgi:adenine-specific DNA-methyltransferase